MKILFLAQLFATIFMTGLIWFVQIVHYPLYNQIGSQSFATYEILHCRLTSYVVGPPMIVEALTAVLMLANRPPQVSAVESYLGAGLVFIIWIATALYSIPNHNTLSAGFAQTAYTQLCTLNWIRTICWTVRSVLLLSWVYRITPPLSLGQ